MKVNYGDAVKLDANAFEAPEGYEFAGWVEDRDSADVDFADEADIDAYTWTKNLELYAKWVPKKYHVNFGEFKGVDADYADGVAFYASTYLII